MIRNRTPASPAVGPTGSSSSEVPAEPADQDIVGSMRADRDAEPADHEHPGEIDPRQPAEDEREPGERLARASPRGAPARRASAEAVTAIELASTVGRLQQPQGREEERASSTRRKSASSYTPAPRNPISGGDRRPRTAAASSGGRRPLEDARSPRSTSLLRPTRATASTRLSTAMPSSDARARTASRGGSNACQPSSDDDQAERQEPVVGQARAPPAPAASRRRPRSAAPRPTAAEPEHARARRPAGAGRRRPGKAAAVA